VLCVCFTFKQLAARISDHLVGREESWNLVIRSVPRDNELRNFDPHKIVLLGFVTLRQIIHNFNEDYASG
jgi:adenosyl cobinamide kinase/adenosyl cobinamide phosphate guanylyltransferase